MNDEIMTDIFLDSFRRITDSGNPLFKPDEQGLYGSLTNPRFSRFLSDQVKQEIEKRHKAYGLAQEYVEATGLVTEWPTQLVSTPAVVPQAETTAAAAIVPAPAADTFMDKITGWFDANKKNLPFYLGAAAVAALLLGNVLSGE